MRLEHPQPARRLGDDPPGEDHAQALRHRLDPRRPGIVLNVLRQKGRGIVAVHLSQMARNARGARRPDPVGARPPPRQIGQSARTVRWALPVTASGQFIRIWSSVGPKLMLKLGITNNSVPAALRIEASKVAEVT